MRALSNQKLRKSLYAYAIVIIGYAVIQVLANGGGLSSAFEGQLVPICAYVVMALSLNLTVGVMGDLSLGHAGFMSVGAFSGAVACIALENMIPVPALRLTASIAVGAVCAGCAGVIIGIPVLRLKGDYLAIVTLAFGEIIKNIITCFYVGQDNRGLRFGFLTSINDLNLGDGARTIIDGPMGLRSVPKLSSFTAGFILILVTLAIILNLVNSRSGRAIMALRDNRIAAESVGIPAAKYKLMAFVTSAALAGAAGTLYVLNFSTTVASKFNFNTSILILLFVVLGGLGNMWGSIVAAALLTVLPEMLRQFNNYRMLVYAIVLILVMLATNNSSVRTLVGKMKEAAALVFKKRGTGR
ncbi:MAG: branched-chain amino acid ABC transporter permease [Clostridiales bacterium]|jgi:branched-chain amino acid transport system permease protein|nr:branched-chain amino acid ABC transporter permease [Clostridiales bacterium]